MKQKYGVCQWCLPIEGPDGCDAVSALGLDGMALEYSQTLRKRAGEYRRRSLDLGIQLPTMGMNVFCNHSYTCPGGKGFFVDQVKSALEIAGETGVGILQIPAFYASAINSDDTLLRAAECLRAACELARPLGLRVGTENALTRAQNLRLFALTDADNLALYFDTQNLLQMEGLRDEGLLEAMRERLCEVHVKDCILGASPIEWAVLGRGETDFADAMENLKRLKYQGWIHLENDYRKTIRGAEGLDWQNSLLLDLDIVRKVMENE